jgi:hypothetical protein
VSGNFKDIAKEANELAAPKRKQGRPKGTMGPHAITKRQVQKARELFEPLVHKAYERIEAILEDDDLDPAVHLRAAKEVLDRRYGTPETTSRVEKIIKDERQSPLSDDAITNADTKYLEQALAALSRFVEHEQQTIDITPD